MPKVKTEHSLKVITVDLSFILTRLPAIGSSSTSPIKNPRSNFNFKTKAEVEELIKQNNDFKVIINNLRNEVKRLTKVRDANLIEGDGSNETEEVKQLRERLSELLKFLYNQC